MQMSRLRKAALPTLAIALASVLSSCGFSLATDIEYTPGVGSNELSGTVSVLSGVIVSAEDGNGVLIASLANRSTDEAITLTGVSSSDVTVGDVEEVELTKLGGARDFVNLADEDVAPIEVAGDFVASNYVEVTFNFSNGENVDIEVPVRRNCGDYAEIDGVEAGPELCASGNDDDANAPAAD